MPTESKTSPNIKFGRFAPTVPVTDMARAIQFYGDVLGLKKTFENGNPVGFAIFEKDKGEIHLTLAKGYVASSRNVAHFLVDDAKALHDHLEGQGVRIIKGLEDADYGMRTFVFADPDGNRIDVGQNL